MLIGLVLGLLVGAYAFAPRRGREHEPRLPRLLPPPTPTRGALASAYRMIQRRRQGFDPADEIRRDRARLEVVVEGSDWSDVVDAARDACAATGWTCGSEGDH